MGTHHAVRSLHLRHKLPLSTSTPTDTVLVVATQSLRSTCTPRRSHWPSWPLLACRRRATTTMPSSGMGGGSATATNTPIYTGAASAQKAAGGVAGLGLALIGLL